MPTRAGMSWSLAPKARVLNADDQQVAAILLNSL